MLTLCVSYAYGMQNKEKIALEDKLLVGIRDNNLSSVKAAIEAGAPVNEIAYLIGYKGEQPLRTAYAKGRLEIAGYLLSRGANKVILNDFLEGSARSADVEKIKWLLAHGAQDADGQALYYAKEYEQDEFIPTQKAKYKEIIRLLEQAKRKSQWRPQPSKGIFKELETEEFLSPSDQPKSTGSSQPPLAKQPARLISIPRAAADVAQEQDRSALIAKLQKEKQQREEIELAKKRVQEEKEREAQATMPQEAPQEERRRVYAR